MATQMKAKPSYKVATFEGLSGDQQRTISHLPPHEDWVAPVVDARRPVSIFESEERYKLEQEKVFRRYPMPVSLSLRLPEPGSVVAYRDYGLPLLLARGKDGRVRAFLNACQHKGSMLVEDCETHKASRLSCPYHAWTYDLTGKLIGVPRESTIANFDRSTRGLTELPCEEAGGLIWVILDPEAEPDFSSIPQQIRDDLDALEIGSAHLYAHRTFDLEANWKLVLEPFLEPYHVQRLHANSVGNMFADGCSAVDNFGLHMRQIAGKLHFKPELLADREQNIHALVTITYVLFPNLVIITSPYYISVMSIVPVSPTKSRINYHMLTLQAPANEKAEDLYARSYEMIQNVFGQEDFRAAEISQVGLSSGALKEVIYCGLEEPVVDYYKRLEEVLGLEPA